MKRDLQEAVVYKVLYEQSLQQLDDLCLLLLDRENASMKKFAELQKEHIDLWKKTCKYIDEANQWWREKIVGRKLVQELRNELEKFQQS